MGDHTRLLRDGRTVPVHRNHGIRNLEAMRLRTPEPGEVPGSGIIRQRKGNARKRRLAPDEERKLVAAAGPHLQRVIICAIETPEERVWTAQPSVTGRIPSPRPPPA